MASSSRFADDYPELIKARLRKRTYLTEPQERELLAAAVEAGVPLREAQECLAATLADRHARRELAFQRDIRVILETLVGKKGWLSRTNFNRAAALHRQLSGGAIGPAEAERRVKQIMLHRGWKIRGQTIFGVPKWFRDIPDRPAYESTASSRS
jgi:hypothetical protein